MASADNTSAAGVDNYYLLDLPQAHRFLRLAGRIAPTWLEIRNAAQERGVFGVMAKD
jgi:hypothetical protein